MRNYFLIIFLVAFISSVVGLFAPSALGSADIENTASESNAGPADAQAQQIVQNTLGGSGDLPAYRQLRKAVRALAEPTVNQTLALPLAADIAESAAFECLAAAVYFEARGEPLTGQMAVARVVLNRVEVQRFPDDVCAVVTQRKQFSFVRDGRIPQADETSRAWRRARAIAYLARNEDWQLAMGHSTDTALFFHADYVAPSWGQVRPRIGQVGAHIFYR